MRSIRLAGHAALLAAMVLLPGAVGAAIQDNSIELGLTFSLLRFDTQSDIDQKLTHSFLAGYNFTKRHGGEFSFTSTSASPDKGGGFPIDIDIYRVGYTYNAYPSEKWVSFFRAGLGWMIIDPIDPIKPPERLTGKDYQAIIYGGGGMRYFLTDQIALRLAVTVDFVEMGQSFANPGAQATGDFGVVFLLGGTEGGEKPAEEKKSSSEEGAGETKPESKPPRR